MAAVVGIEVIQPGEKVDSLLECLKEKFPDRAGPLDATMIEIHDLSDTTYDELRGEVEGALGECDGDWPQIVRLLKSPQT